MKDIYGKNIPQNLAGKRLKDMTEQDHQQVFATLKGRRARVKVAYNLHNGRYSIRYKGKVQCYVDSVTLSFVEFEVDENRRKMVLESGHKNVHAFVKGFLTGVPIPEMGSTAVRYNPFESAEFRTYPEDEPINAAILMHLYKEGEKYRMTAYNATLKRGIV